MQAYDRILGFALLAVLTLMGGCVDRTGRINQARPPRGSSPTPSPSDRDRLLKLDVQQLTQYPNGSGIGVADPVLKLQDPNGRLLALGAGRWLRFHTASQPDLHKTPYVGDLDQVCREMDARGRPQTIENMGGPYSRFGVTHVAVGEASGTSDRLTITYQLWEVPARKRVGSPVRLSGTPGEVTSGLPGVARELTKLAGSAASAFPDPPEETTADLQLLGRFSQRLGHHTVADHQALANLTERSAVAALVALTPPITNGWQPGVRFNIEGALRRYPENGQLLTAAAWSNTAPNYTQARVRELIPRNPQSYILHCADLFLASNAKNQAGMALAAAESARSSTRNRDAWLNLAQGLSGEANGIRQGRAAASITEEEWGRLRTLYDLWRLAAGRSTEIDPDYLAAQFELSQAAVFSGDYPIADRALWRSLDLARPEEKSGIYWWGFEMYAPKWMDEPERRHQLAHRAAADTYATSEHRVYVAKLLQAWSFEELVPRVAKTPAEQAQVRAASKPAEHEHAHTHAEGEHAQHAAERKTAPVPQAVPRSGTHYTNDRGELKEVMPSESAPEQARRIGVHRGGALDVAWSPDGTRLATCGTDGNVSVWSEAGALLHRFPGHKGTPNSLGWNKDGRWLASGDLAGAVRVWDAQTGAARVLRNGGKAVYAVAWTGDGRYLVAGGDDGLVWRWNAATWKAEPPMVEGRPIRSLTAEPGGALLAVTGGWMPSPKLRVWDVRTAEKKFEITVNLSELHPVAWRADGAKLAAGGPTGIDVWDRATGEVAHLASRDHPLDLDWSNDGASLVCNMGLRRTVRVVNLDSTANNSFVEDRSRSLGEVSLHPKTGRLAAAGYDGSVWLWDKPLAPRDRPAPGPAR